MCLLAASLLLTTLGACADGEPPDAGPAPSSSSPSESGSDPSPSPSPTESTEPATPEVEPLTGPRVVTKRFTFRVPEGWEITSGDLPLVQLVRDPGNKSGLREPHGLIGLSVFPSGRSFTLEQEARQSDAKGRRLDDIDLDGEPAYHFSAHTSFDSNDSFGLWREPFESIRIRFGLFGASRAKRAVMIDSVLATWKWKS